MDPRGKIRWDFACICWKGDVGSLRTASNEPRGTDVINNWFDTTATSGVIPVLTPLADSVGIPVTNWTTSILRDQGIRYKGSPTTSVTRIRGIPKVNLRVKPSQSRGMLVAYLYSVDRFGMGTLVTHGARALHWATPMQSVDFSFELNATAFDVPAGNRLELVFDTSDSLYASPVRIGESFNMTIETGAASASLVLPTR
jgi:predicted acyl esterase